MASLCMILVYLRCRIFDRMRTLLPTKLASAFARFLGSTTLRKAIQGRYSASVQPPKYSRTIYKNARGVNRPMTPILVHNLFGRTRLPG